MKSVFKTTKPHSLPEEDDGATIDFPSSPTQLGTVSYMFGKGKNYGGKSQLVDYATANVDSFEKSTDTNSLSSIASIATISTNTYFGNLGHSGKLECDTNFDAFMGLPNIESKELSKDLLEARTPTPAPSNLVSIQGEALKSIAQRDFITLLNIIKNNPSLLLYQCKKEGYSHLEKVHGCNGGTLLHVMVSQRPVLKKKRVLPSSKRLTLRMNPRSGPYEIHVMPSVPESVLLHIIKLHPEALAMTDDYERLPLHCATLNLFKNLEEISELCSSHGYQHVNKSEDVSRFVMRGTNLVKVLLKYYQIGASKSDYKGNLPIHYAASMPSNWNIDMTINSNLKKGSPSCPEDTVKALLDAFPCGIGEKNMRGELPIHIMCSLGPMLNISSLQHLLLYHREWRDLPFEKNLNGDSPVHLAVKNRVPHYFLEKFASFHHTLDTAKLFLQTDGMGNNLLHVALLMHPQPDEKSVSFIMTAAPICARIPNSEGIMPIKYAVKHHFPDDIIIKILAQDMPIQIGTMENEGSSVGVPASSRAKYTAGASYGRAQTGFLRQVIERLHHNSWWYVAVDCGDKYIHALHTFLSRHATHPQIVALARQIGPDGKSIFINSASYKCRLMIHSLLRFYDRYEILLSSDASSIRIYDGVQSFHALDFGPLSSSADDDISSLGAKRLSAVVKVGEINGTNKSVEVSLLSEVKGKVLLRCYHYEEGFLAELKVRDAKTLSSTYVEEIYNHHRDENYSHLTLSKAENLCCIAFEQPDHTLEEVFSSISSSNRSQKWIEKCWVVLRQIAEALKHIHDRNIVHGHLNPANISKYGNVWKLSHLGTVVKVGSRMRGLVRPCSPPESVIISRRASRERVSIMRNQLMNFRYTMMSSQLKQNHQNRVKFSDCVKGEKKNACLRFLSKKRSKIASVDNQSSNYEKNDEVKTSETFFNFKPWREFKEEEKEEIPDNFFQEHSIDHNQDTIYPLIFAPEKCIASPAWDMWAYGLVMVQLLLGRCTDLPNFEKADDAILKNLYNYDASTLNKIVKQVDAAVGKDAANLVSHLLQKDPVKRPKSMDAVLKHEYFQSLTIYI